MKTQRDVRDDWRLHPAVIFGVSFVALLLLHQSLLRLPYFWDEAGYYVPAARDFFLSGSLIPHSTPSNAHPPLVMMYLAFWWKIAGFAPIVTRIAMLAIAAFGLTGLFRLAFRIAGREVAIASALCTALYPVFFVQSSLAQVDLPAAGFTFWALLAYVENRRVAVAIWFSLAALSKETAILAPISLLMWEVLRRKLPSRFGDIPGRPSRIWPFLAPIIPLALWFGYHHHATGFVFGNPEFFRYNVEQTLFPLRIVLAFLMRIWQVFGYLNLYVLTLSAVFAMWLPPNLEEAAPEHPTAEKSRPNSERPRIALPVQFAFLSLTLTYTMALAVVGGAVLARYMLPVIPLVIVVCVSTLRRRVHLWRAVIAVVVVSFIAALFINPPYGFSLEDNLAYRDYIELHQRAENFVQLHYPNARVLTAWPASDELSRSYMGYVGQPIKVFRVEDFTADELSSAKEVRSQYDVAIVFSTKYEPPRSVFDKWRTWQEWKRRFFGYHRDLPPAAAAQILGGRVIYLDRREGQWVGVIEIDRLVDARL